MRFLFSFIIWIVIVGGLWVYTTQRDEGRSAAVEAHSLITQAEDHYSLELTPTFSGEEDPFSLQLGEKTEAPLEVSINGRGLQLGTEAFERGAVIRIDGLDMLTKGNNELYLKASPPLSESHFDHGIRVRILHTQGVVIDKTIWSSKGSLVSGSMSFQLEDEKKERESHDH